MEKYLNLDLLAFEIEIEQEAIEQEMSALVENYDNFIILNKRENIGLKHATPIKTLKKELEINANVEFEEKKTIILEIESEIIIRGMFEEEEDVSKDVFVLINSVGIIIDFNR